MWGKTEVLCGPIIYTNKVEAMARGRQKRGNADLGVHTILGVHIFLGVGPGSRPVGMAQSPLVKAGEEKWAFTVVLPPRPCLPHSKTGV